MLETTSCSGCGKACDDPYEENADWIALDPGSDLRIIRTGILHTEVSLTDVEYFCCSDCVAAFIRRELGLRG